MAKITEKLEKINITLEKILDVMNKRKNPFLLALEIAGMIAGIFGIIVVVDIIFSWFKEGL